MIEGDPTTKGLNVNIVGDDAGIGGGTQYAVNAALGAAPTGTLALAKRDDALSALSPVEADAVELRVDGEGALWVIPSGTTTVDGTVTANAGTNLNTSTLATSAKQLADGHEVSIGAATGAAGDLAKIEDATHSTGDVGVMALAVENEDLADLSTGDKDYTPIAVTKEGVVIVKQEGTIAVTESTPLTGFATSAGQLADGHAVTIDNLSSNEVYVRGSGTAGSADAGVLSVQGIASMTPLAVTESSPISGFATSAKQLADGHNVTIDNAASAAAVNIQDGGNTITVDGTVTADLSATDNAVLDNIALYTQGSETALEKIDGAIVGPGEPTIDSYTHASINLAAAANQVLVSSAASKQIWVYGIGFVVNVAGTVSFQDEDDLAITGIMPFAANSGMAIAPSGNFAMPIWKLGTDKDLEVDIVTSELDGFIDYAIVSV